MTSGRERDRPHQRRAIGAESRLQECLHIAGGIPGVVRLDALADEDMQAVGSVAAAACYASYKALSQREMS